MATTKQLQNQTELPTAPGLNNDTGDDLLSAHHSKNQKETHKSGGPRPKCHWELV